MTPPTDTPAVPTDAALPPQYTPADVEPAMRAKWDDAKAWHATPDSPGAPYAVVIPPPNVTAALHLGHALNNTLQDVLVRYHRMLGRNVMWMPGTDHAGIATQTVVEKRVFAEEGKRRTDFTRDAFIAKVQKWKDEYEQRIIDQLKEMGCSCDWDRQRFTMDEVCAAAVREAFFRLFKDGLIYRGKRLVNWDPVTQTALADDEVEMQEVDGQFYYMKYPLWDAASQSEIRSQKSEIQYVTVATTRPETMLGDTAVAVNPNDEHRRHLIGKHVKLPIVGRIIPIIGDDYVVIPHADAKALPHADAEERSDEASGKAAMASGFLKVTPAHDPNDYDIGQRHSLPIINVMAPDASISKDHGWPAEEWNTTTTHADAEQSEASGAHTFMHTLLGLSREDARRAIVRWFREHDLLEDQKPYRHSVGHSYRSHAPIEPYYTDQWYVKVTDDRLRGVALQAMAPDQRRDATPPQQSRDRKEAVPPAQVHPTPVAYLITFTAHGSWLKGDGRGWIDPDHNTFGDPIPVGDESVERREFEKLKKPPIVFEETQRRAIQHAILETAEHRGWGLLALHVRSNHVHALVVASDAEPEKVMNDFKAYATRRLRDASLVSSDQKVWTRHGSTRYLWDQSAVQAAKRYVLDQQGGPLAPAPHEGKPLPHGRGSDEPVGSLPDGRGSDEAWRGKLRFYPDRYAKTFENWHENIRDWCISRQLWWGHRIPVWISSEGEAFDDTEDSSTLYSTDRVALQSFGGQWFACVRDQGDREAVEHLESKGFTQDPDVLDTWFSSALWPMSTMGWPNPANFPDQIPEGDAVLNTWNPTTVLSTAREIITLWVSRMVMFNLYFNHKLPFHDVFIHAMIQDGHGQKMSKSLGNGVDPSDIIHSHGSDAMRYTLTAMTTQTQDVRLPVDCIVPGSGETVTPKFITGPGGYKVMAPVQEHPPGSGKKFATSYGIASGEVKPPEMGGAYPVARNTSEKFDLGQRFANKLWNAVRFALSNLTPAHAAPTNLAADLRSADSSTAAPSDAASVNCDALGVADRWVLSRLARTVRLADQSLKDYQFAPYAQALYDFIWRDLCDWYIEAVKPTVKDSAQQQQVLAACIDASLRLLHPVMPFVSERLWEGLNAAVPHRGVQGLTLPGNAMLMTAAWPRAQGELIDEQAERDFELIRSIVSAVREVRSTHNVPPRKLLETTCRAPAPIAQKLLGFRGITTTLAYTVGCGVGPQIERPADAVVVSVAGCELYIHGLVDKDAERERLGKRLAELESAVANFDKRLSNESYTAKAPAKLVQETRDQREAAVKERDSVREQLAGL